MLQRWGRLINKLSILFELYYVRRFHRHYQSEKVHANDSLGLGYICYSTVA